MAGYDPWLNVLRAEARKAVGDNQRAMTSPGAAAVHARRPEQQW